MSWQEFPFVGGAHQDVDPRLAPNGVLYSVKNLRHVKDGRWAKRYRYDSVLPTLGNGSAIPANNVLSLSSLGPDRLILAGDPVRLYNYAPDRGRVYPYDVDEPNVVWAPSTFTAAEARVVKSQSDESTAQLADSATLRDYTVVVCLDESKDLVAHVYSDPDGNVKVHQQKLALNSDGAITLVQAVAVGLNIVVMWHQVISATNTVLFDYLPVLTSQEFSGSPVTVGTLAAGAGRSSLQADGITVLISYQSGVDEITAERWASPWSAALTSVTATSGVADTLHSNCYASASVGNSCIVWTQESNGDVECVVGNGTFGSLSSTTSLDTSGNAEGQPIVAGESARMLVAWQVADATLQRGIRQIYITNGGSPGTAREYWGWRLVSNFVSALFSADEHFAIATPHKTGITRGDFYALKFKLDDIDLLALDNIAHLRFADGTIADTSAFATIARPHIHRAGIAGDRLVFAFRHSPPQLGTTVSLWEWYYQGVDRGHPAKFGSGLYFPCGVPFRWDGAQPAIAGFVRPGLFSLAAGTSGSLTVESTYQVLAVYEREDADGVVTLSEPSDPIAITLAGSENSLTASLIVNPTSGQYSRVRIYRTLANGDIFYYDHTITSSRGSWQDNALVTTPIAQADSTIESNHILYTDIGGVVPNGRMPACKYTFRAGRRLWAIGLEEPVRARCSKELLYTSEAASFPAREEFSVITAEPIIGGGSLDSIPILFSRTGITAIVGPGPDDAGRGVFETREIPTDAGLVSWGHRSIVETAIGMFFQSTAGIHLLPRGLGPPEFIGAPIRDTLENYPYITSAIVDSEEREVRFLAVDDLDSPTDSIMLVYDLRASTWIISEIEDENAAPFICAGVWGEDARTHVLATDDITDGFFQETSLYQTTDYLEGEIVTADFRLGNLNRYGRCRKAQFLVEYRAASRLKVELSTDGGVTWSHTHTWFLSSHLPAYPAGTIVPLEWHLPIQKMNRVRFRITDIAAPTNGTEGVVYYGMALEMRGLSGGNRLRGVQRA